MNQNEDEWLEIQHRFAKEGIDFINIKPNDRLVHLWRWLVDAEINLKNSRRMFDKLREQQNEELESMENYLGKIREISEKRVVGIENENTKIRQQLETISLVVSQVVLQGESLADKVNNLVTDYLKITEEVEILNKLKLNNPQFDDLISEIIKISSEKEILKRETIEMSERMQLLQKSSRELELDNEKLAFKLSEAFAELEDKEIRLGEFTTVHCGEFNNMFNSVHLKEWESNKLNPSSTDSDNLNIDRNCNTVDKIDLSQNINASSVSPSLILDDMSEYKSTSKLSSLMSSCHEIARLEENKKLQSECESLRNRTTSLGEKYNTLALKYIQLKAKRKFQLEELRGRLETSQCQIESLQVQLSVQRQRLRAEEIFRKQIESDLRKVQDEKRNILVRLMNTEMEQKENNREIIVLQKKISVLDLANSDLQAKLLRLKYKGPVSSDIFPIKSI